MKGCPRKAAIATRNPGKIRPTARVLQALCGIGRDDLVPVDPPGDLPPQPVGSLEVVRGALLRAIAAAEALEWRGLGIGIEAGLLEFYTSTGYIETQVAVIAGPGRRVSLGWSAGFELPPGIVEAMKRGTELGRIYAPRRGVGDLGETIGYIGVETMGLVSREDLTFQAVAMALLPWIHGNISYLQTADELAQAINI